VAAFHWKLCEKSTLVLTLPHHTIICMGDRFDENEDVEMTIYKWLQMQELGFHRSKIFKHVPTWNISVNVLMD
jgi:hypothetical protein